MQRRRAFLTVTLAIGLAQAIGVGLPGTAHAQATKLRMNIIAPPQNWLTRELAAWSEEVGRATQGASPSKPWLRRSAASRG